VNEPTLHHPTPCPRPCLIDRALEQAALVHWPQVCIAAITAFAAGLLAGWGWM